MFKKFTFLFSILLLLTMNMTSNIYAMSDSSNDKYRTVITTDGEVDDMNSMIRFLYYANEVKLEGIILTSSVFHYAGDSEKGIEPFRWTGTDWIEKMIDAYEEIQPNLIKHANGYPSPQELRNIIKIGNIKNEGDMSEETEGSKFLEELFLNSKDTSPLYVQTWGGTNTTARALKSIEEKYKDSDEWPQIQQMIYDKLVLYIILDQDKSYADYIAVNWPELKVIKDTSNFWHFAYAWQTNSPELNKTLKANWQKEYILNDNGPLMDLYASMGDGKWIEGELPEEQRGSDEYLQNNPDFKKYDFISEGDSPSFFFLIQNGLNDVNNPEFGGWGGRFTKLNHNLLQNQVVDYNPYSNQYEASYTLSRWFDDIQEDFAARIAWGLAENFSDANHYPELYIKEGTELSAKPGEKITLTMDANDPDNDELNYTWWRYFEADTYNESEVRTEPTTLKDGDFQLDITRPLEKIKFKIQ
ncbi:Protein of unknown function [Ignavigranum ruoffiae]|uniref:Cellulose-binding Sde182 nucleoside hydrolase-like domain-containing protein n=1 Tax=Ignavigranum ruoffiae TaxID=89093 RepID=A0A1H9B7K8_9LACT|nr:DUF1593 domain-containing protein [Ignavigranum ruoffiae]SEP84238.1 Protein of unknown function [Ignavigranum ruoffiae]